MTTKLVIYILVFKMVSGQLNGEFWWLNKNIVNYKSASPSPPTFEDLSEFDTDESAKITFRENQLIGFDKPQRTSKMKTISNGAETKPPFTFQDKSVIVFPGHKEDADPAANRSEQFVFKSDNSLNERKNLSVTKTSEDIFEFKFPEDDDSIWNIRRNESKLHTTPKLNVTNNIKNVTSSIVLVNEKPDKVLVLSNKVPLQVHMNPTPESENICTVMKKSECSRKHGIVYSKGGGKKFSVNSQLICCILPISPTDADSKIHFKDISLRPRFKRSNKAEKLTPALKQRNALLMRRFGPQPYKIRSTVAPTTIITKKIVTQDDDDIDPYWNIKNANFKNPGSQNPTQAPTDKYDYVADDYVEDYVVELPKPGLVGVYSDHDGYSPNWSITKDPPTNPYGVQVSNDDDEDDDTPSFGYGANLDPRLEDRLVSMKRGIQGKPPKLPHTFTNTASQEFSSFESETQTISYQSNPDFQVLNGFKLLNLVSNKSKIYKNGKKTTHNIYKNNSKESVIMTSNFDSYEEDLFDTNRQVFSDCGKTASTHDYKNDKNMGESDKQSQPWLALVVLTRKRQSILCYATIVHSRAAVTAADCVHGRNNCPGEVTLIAGAWDLSDENHEGWQKRMSSVYFHEQYKPGAMANNLAVLHWKRPLRLGARVQPACLTDPHVGDDCRFVGWGGYDQAIRSKPRWQKASILTPRACSERLTSKTEALPSDAFCAAVHSRGTVTGVGASLVCGEGGRDAAAGVAVRRDAIVVLTPAHGWTMHALRHLALI